MLLVWNGSPSPEEYKLTFLSMLEFGKLYPVDSMLSDISRQGVINPENRKWFEKEMMPRAVAAGLMRAAIVTNGNSFKLYYINIILSSVRKFPIVTKLFKSQKEAFDWLYSFPVSTHSISTVPSSKSA
jgi:predicted transcriptional regulator with HTH domain